MALRENMLRLLRMLMSLQVILLRLLTSLSTLNLLKKRNNPKPADCLEPREDFLLDL